MQYRQLGNTGIEVSALGFGCMRLPKKNKDSLDVDMEASVLLLQHAFELGVNYFDTAYLYDGGDSERALGQFLKHIDRDKVTVVSKNPVGHQFWPLPGNKAPGLLWRQCLEEELRWLDTEYIDAYLFHAALLVPFHIIIDTPEGPLEQAKKAKEEGLIRHIGFSSHDTPVNIVRMLEIAEGVIELIVIQYNLLDRKNEPVIDYCRKHGIGVAIMGPIGGGQLIHPSSVYRKAVNTGSPAEVALRFVLANPGVSTAMSGMNSREQLEQNVHTVSRAGALSREELAGINQIQAENKRLLDLYCTACKYCLPCPTGVDIPANFSALNLLKVHGLAELAQRQYEKLDKTAAEHCLQCGQCLPKCPQQIEIPTRLAEVVQELGLK